MGKFSRSFVVILAALAIAVAFLASTSFAENYASKAAKKKPAIATLAVENPNVSVKKKGSDTFVPATNGQKLRQGDTIQTDATGRATVNYTDDAYTRLDVNTTLTIERLTQDKGARQIKSSLDTGRTWNRTEALTESGSFEQSGAGATAAVIGTAFVVSCLDVPSPLPGVQPTRECSFLGVYHQIILKSDENGELRDIPEFGECTSVDADLCDDVHQLTQDEVAAITWVQENLLRDLTEHNFGPGPYIPSFNVIVENGQIVSVTQNPPPPSPLALTSSSSSTTSSSTTSSTTTSSTTTSSTTTTTSLPPPTVNITDIGSSRAALVPPTGPSDKVVSEDEVGSGGPTFVINVTGPDGHIVKVVFTDLPDGSFGAVYFRDTTTACCNWQLVQTDTEYDPGTIVYQFRPVQLEPGGGTGGSTDCQSPTPTAGGPTFDDCWPDAQFPNSEAGPVLGTVQWSQSFTIKAVDTTPLTPTESAPVTVDLVAVDDICVENPNRAACDLLSGVTSAESTPSTTLPSTTAPPTTPAIGPPTTTEATTTPTTEESTTSGTDGG